jgi:DNA helicase-2/ATP-dependent DNA helicase PcrA
MALNADQARAVAVRDGLCVVIAGPGTGKTETLAAKTAALIEAGERPLVVTFTRSAAHTVTHRLGALRHAATIGTCHSLAFRVLRRVPSPQPSSKRLLHAWEKERILRRLVQHRRFGLDPVEIEERITRLKARDAITDDDQELLTLYAQEKGPCRMDFQDLLIDATQLLISAEEWRILYQSSYTHVLIDEAQDLDPLQARFIARFLPPQNVLTVFMDPDQTIYSYAGADPDVLLHLCADFPKTSIELRMNYRSHPGVLGATQRLIRHNGSKRTMVPVRAGEGRPRFARVRDETVEACVVAETVHRLLRNGVAPTEVLCLVRRNSDRTVLEIELARRQIPFSLLQASHEWHPTYLEWAVQPLTACLLVASGSDDPDWWEAVLRPSVGSTHAQQLARAADRHAAATALGERVATRVAMLEREIVEMRQQTRLPVTVLGELATRITSLRGRELDGALHGLRWFPTLTAFVSHIATLRALTQTPHEQRIRLSTVHRAKGHEASIVFLLGMSEGIFPLATASIEEERRLCFVALSRAQDFLFVTSPRSVGGTPRDASRFLAEAGLRRRWFPSAARIHSLMAQTLAPFPAPTAHPQQYIQQQTVTEMRIPVS